MEVLLLPFREKVWERLTCSAISANILAGVGAQGRQDVTTMLAAWAGGDADALDRLMDLLYPELRRIAHHHLEQRRAGESLESAALADEAYLKLVQAGGIRCENRVHFLALCSQVMRRILVDHARRRGSARRGGNRPPVPLDELLLAAEARGVEILALDEALQALARLDPRKCRVVELRYFGGLSIEETAQFLGVSADTAKRDWRLARAWLFAQLGGNQASAEASAKT
jgi:RNA polymerase sigma factor (TIGR02999 family)